MTLPKPSPPCQNCTHPRNVHAGTTCQYGGCRCAGFVDNSARCAGCGTWLFHRSTPVLQAARYPFEALPGSGPGRLKFHPAHSPARCSRKARR